MISHTVTLEAGWPTFPHSLLAQLTLRLPHPSRCSKGGWYCTRPRLFPHSELRFDLFLHKYQPAFAACIVAEAAHFHGSG